MAGGLRRPPGDSSRSEEVLPGFQLAAVSDSFHSQHSGNRGATGEGTDGGQAEADLAAT